MRIVDKHITGHVTLAYVFAMLVFVGLYCIADMFGALSDILKTKPSLEILATYYLYTLPFIALQVSPFCVLIAVLYSFGEFNKDNELVALRAAGLSSRRIIVPAITLAFTLSCLALLTQEKVLIYSQMAAENIKSQFIKKESLGTEEKNVIFSSKSSMLYARRFDHKKGALYDVILFKGDESSILAQKLACQTAYWRDNRWVGENVVEYTLDQQGGISGQPTQTASAILDIDESPRQILLKKTLLAEFAPLRSIIKEIKWFRRINAPGVVAALKVDYQQRLAQPLANFFLVLGVIPAAIHIRKRKVTLSAMGMGFIFAFLYYLLSSMGTNLGKTGLFTPVLGAWLAPLFFSTAGLAGMWAVK